MEQYAFLIVTGAPDNTEFGIDRIAISITDEFRGVKLIPKGRKFLGLIQSSHFQLFSVVFSRETTS